MVGQAAPDRKRSRRHTRAGKRSAVRGRGRLSEAEPAAGLAQAATKRATFTEAAEGIAEVAKAVVSP